MKYWDIIPPKKIKRKKPKVDFDGIRKALKEHHERENVPYRIYGRDVTCLHKQCSYCKGTGITKFGAVCVHAISCPCSNCQPWMMGFDVAKLGSDRSERVYIDARGITINE